MLFQLITWGTMVAMMIVSNNYLKTATGSLSEINTIEELAVHNARYLRVSQFNLDKQFGSSYTEFRSSGKYNQYLNFDTYFVYPFKTQNSDSQFKYWYGVKMHEQISNKIEPEEKEEKYQNSMRKLLKILRIINSLKLTILKYYLILMIERDLLVQ